MITGFQPPGVIYGAAPGASVIVLRDVTPGRESPVRAVFTNSDEFQFDTLPPGQYCVTTRLADDAIVRWTPEARCRNRIVELAPGESKGL